MGITNEMVGESNKCENEVGKTRLEMKFSKNQFWKFIGRIILEMNYGFKKYAVFGGGCCEYDHGKVIGQTQKEISGERYLLKLSFHLYSFN